MATHQIIEKRSNLTFRLWEDKRSCFKYVLRCFSHVQLFETLWMVVHHAPLSMGFSRQEYWSGLPCLPPEDLPNPGIKLASLMSPTLAGRFFTTHANWEAPLGL